MSRRNQKGKHVHKHHVRRYRLSGQEPICIVLLEHKMHYPLIRRTKPIIAPDGSLVFVCLPGGRTWHAYGIKHAMCREIREELNVDIEVYEVFGPIVHPLSGKETFFGRARLKNPPEIGLPELRPGKNIEEAWWVEGGIQVARQTEHPLTPIIMKWLGLTKEFIRMVRESELGK